MQLMFSKEKDLSENSANAAHIFGQHLASKPAVILHAALDLVFLANLLLRLI